MSFASIPELLDELRAGRMVVIVDDEDRENEGDLIMAAELVKPSDINFMVTHARGLVCLSLTRERCAQLGLNPMVRDNTSQHHTNFTTSIEAAEGVTTGISAYDRAHTVRTAVRPDARPSDLSQPGHIFPLMAQPGGVLVRAGHTEAGCDLARLAGFTPAAVIVEILNEDGSMARRPDLEAFAAQHGLKIGTIADLIHYRIRNEKTIERITECALPTAYGEFRVVAYQDVVDSTVHLALVRGDPPPDRPVLVRVHVQSTLCDLFDATQGDCGWPLRSAMQQIADADEGVIVVLRNHDTARELVQRIQDHKWRAAGEPLPARGRIKDKQLRTYGVGAQILRECGVQKMQLMGQPRRMPSMAGYGLEITGYIPKE